MNKISRAHEDYLEAILLLELNKKEIISINIAKLLKVSKPAVSKALNELATLGLVNKSKYSDVSLSKKGRAIAKAIYHRHLVIKNALIKLGINKKTAENDCCKIEHVISETTLRALEKYVNN